MIRPLNRIAIDDWPGLPACAKSVAKSSNRESGMVEIGKVNIILIGLIVVILFALISKEETGSRFSNQTARIPNQIVVDAAPEAKAELPAVSELPENASPSVVLPAPEKAAVKPSDKKHKQVDVAVPARDSGPVVQVHTTEVQTAQSSSVVEPAPPKDATTKILVFNIWSVSELRLRSAYTTLMNDSGVPAVQLESRKKEYLGFVAQRARKCGELDNKFTSNINTAEKLSFNKGDVDVLECYAAENNTELDKLSLSTARSS